jgi:hypothetical protein
MTDLGALESELELLVMDVVAGGPNTTRLHRSVRRVVDARLRREIGSDLKDYAVSVGPDATGEGLEVTVQLQMRDRARTIRLRSASMIR